MERTERALRNERGKKRREKGREAGIGKEP